MRSLAPALAPPFAAGSAAVACPTHTAGHDDGDTTTATAAQRPPARPSSQGGQGRAA